MKTYFKAIPAPGIFSRPPPPPIRGKPFLPFLGYDEKKTILSGGGRGNVVDGG